MPGPALFRNLLLPTKTKPNPKFPVDSCNKPNIAPANSPSKASHPKPRARKQMGQEHANYAVE
jgi:hypothetical protein